MDLLDVALLHATSKKIAACMGHSRCCVPGMSAKAMRESFEKERAILARLRREGELVSRIAAVVAFVVRRWY